MDSNKIEEQMAKYYGLARKQIKNGNSVEARNFVLLMLNTTKNYDTAKMDKDSFNNLERFKKKWLDVAIELRVNGITEEIKKIFKVSSYTQSQGWVSDVFEQVADAVVSINCKTSNKTSNGTGFIISYNGYLLTNHHVIFNTDDMEYYQTIIMKFETGEEYPLEIIASDSKNDVAFCHFDINNVKSFKIIKLIKDYSTLKKGADILVIGNAMGWGISPFEGLVKLPHNDEQNLLYTAFSNPGDSGGPVINRFGECVGINTSVTIAVRRKGITSNVQGITNACPMDKIKPLLQKWCVDKNIEL